MNLTTNHNSVRVEIPSYKYRHKKIIALIMALVTWIFVLFIFYKSFSLELIIYSILFSLLFGYIGYSYFKCYIWLVKGIEIFEIFGDSGRYIKYKLERNSEAEYFKVDINFSICKYIKIPYDDFVAPRSDAWTGSYGGKIKVCYRAERLSLFKRIFEPWKDRKFLFGKNLTDEEADLIIKTVQDYVNSIRKNSR